MLQKALKSINYRGAHEKRKRHLCMKRSHLINSPALLPKEQETKGEQTA